MTTFFQLSDLGLLGSPSGLLQQWLAYMQSIYPGYQPQPANLEYIQAVIFASWASDLAYLASQGATELFTQYGQNVVGVQMEQGQTATAVAVINAADTAGHTLPAGTQFILDGQYGFSSTLPAVIPAGSTSTTVTIAATAPGVLFNGAGSTSIALNQSFNWVSSVSIVTVASNGIDPETPDAYLQRLVGVLRLAAPRPITASDYGLFALNFQPQPGTLQQPVGRATAIDGYDPQIGYNAPAALASGAGNSTPGGTYGNQREVTVCVTDPNGNALSSTTITALQAWFQALREANFLVNVISPTYSPIYVTCSVQRTGEFDPATVQAAIQSALISWLSPANWGLPQDGAGVGWLNTTVIYQSVIQSVIQSATGVQNIVAGTLKFGLAATPTNTADLTLPGPVALPTSSTTTIPLSAITVTN